MLERTVKNEFLRVSFVLIADMQRLELCSSLCMLKIYFCMFIHKGYISCIAYDYAAVGFAIIEGNAGFGIGRFFQQRGV